jgi:hypothetical protein
MALRADFPFIVLAAQFPGGFGSTFKIRAFKQNFSRTPVKQPESHLSVQNFGRNRMNRFSCDQ